MPIYLLSLFRAKAKPGLPFDEYTVREVLFLNSRLK